MISVSMIKKENYESNQVHKIWKSRGTKTGAIGKTNPERE
jgi:hypothetical protein